MGYFFLCPIFALPHTFNMTTSKRSVEKPPLTQTRGVRKDASGCEHPSVTDCFAPVCLVSVFNFFSAFFSDELIKKVRFHLGPGSGLRRVPVRPRCRR